MPMPALADLILPSQGWPAHAATLADFSYVPPGKRQSFPKEQTLGSVTETRKGVGTDGTPEDVGDLQGFEVDAVEPFHGQRDLHQRVFTAALGAELGPGAVLEGPGRDAGEVEQLPLVVGLQRVEEADDVRLPRDLLVAPYGGRPPGIRR